MADAHGGWPEPHVTLNRVARKRARRSTTGEAFVFQRISYLFSRLRNPPTRKRNQGFRPIFDALEDRLALSWAGVPPATVTPPSSFSSVTLNSQGDASGSSSITSNEIDWRRFTASTTGAYTISATTPSSNVDTVLGVYNANGQRLGFNDDISSSNLDSRLTISLTAGASYFFGITNYTGTGQGSYSWLVDGPAASGGTTDDSFENNDTFATAFNLGTLTTVRTVNGLQMRDAADWFRFTQNSAGTSSDFVRITFTHSQGDLDLELYNSQGQRLRFSNGVANSEQVSLNGLASGTYYVRAFGFNGAQNPSYTLVVDPGTASPPPPPPPTSGGFDIVVNTSGLTASQVTIFNQAAARWEQIITGDLPNAVFNGATVDDLRIEASAPAIDGPGGTLGQAGPDAFRSGTFLPYHGVMQFDSADLAGLEANGQLLSVILHEMGHVLGIGTIWSARGLLSGAGTSNPRFTGQQATAAYNQIFSRSESSVPVENTGGPGTADGHFRESVFVNELMTGFLNSGSNPLSRITIGSLADLGYTVNFSVADAYSPPPGAALTSSSSNTSGTQSNLRSLVAGAFTSSGRSASHDLATALSPRANRSFSTSVVDEVFATAVSSPRADRLLSTSVVDEVFANLSEISAGDIYGAEGLCDMALGGGVQDDLL